ncbi:unnamed protein product [Hyaloperonospora brassicae]|uniref:Uncharacterized protein n=1 Tax=Hyaloperonospora brassicae TaxID=162125 RepID=A0AAV0UC05_HYABA|nr:unnamed protein product [Hyaloperonospora brassicae]
MPGSPTSNHVQVLRDLTLADEHLMICFCGWNRESDVDTQVLLKAVEKIVRIKLQMGDQHRISLAREQGSTLVVEQEFTRNVAALLAAVPTVLGSASHGDMVDLEALLADAARYFSAQRDMERKATSSFRLLLVYRQSTQRPQLHVAQQEEPNQFITDPVFHLDVIYWHRDVPLELAQHVFDELCSYDNANPLAKFYFLEVGGSVERLHQALVLMLSHPAHRLSQSAAEQLLSSRFSPSKTIDSLGQQD